MYYVVNDFDEIYYVLKCSIHAPLGGMKKYLKKVEKYD